ncbi:hypothetical protein FDP41_008411 [Naegleria fowleri]|uniref:Uncharacterized protein n=1 Tax=Naegleria fowleri TaxID=5763 RepID=A0A6A5BGM5_NAEFO|nr:uncharacterized protein FDP41_008411 [Naegleria fowleri]KAF0973204.1 hypothetical protein FDP41_008411 [Naegleria fowleri]CAG4709575.1 unnamed protein product [Naegleria fowleri]
MKELLTKPFEFSPRNRHEKRYNPYLATTSSDGRRETSSSSLRHKRVHARVLLSTRQRRLLMGSDDDDDDEMDDSSMTSSNNFANSNTNFNSNSINTTTLNNFNPSHTSNNNHLNSLHHPHPSCVHHHYHHFNSLLQTQLKTLVDQFFESLLKNMETMHGRKALIMTEEDRQRLQQELLVSTDFVKRVLNNNRNTSTGSTGGGTTTQQSMSMTNTNECIVGFPNLTLFQFERFLLQSGKEVFVMVSNLIPGHRSIYLATFSIINR